MPVLRQVLIRSISIDRGNMKETEVAIVTSVLLLVISAISLGLHWRAVHRDRSVLCITSVDFETKGDLGSHFKARLVNKGRLPVIIDKVVLRDSQSREVTSAYITRTRGMPVKLEPGMFCSIELVPPEEDFDRAKVVAVVAYETTGKTVKYELSREQRKEIRAFWKSE